MPNHITNRAINNMEQSTYFDQLWDQYDHFIFDYDGVLADNNVPFEKVPQVLNYLQNELHKSVYVLSNYSGLTVEHFMKSFKDFHISIPAEKIYCSSMLVPKYLAKNYPEVKNVYYLGCINLKSQLEKYGYTAIGIEDNHTKLTSYDEVIKAYLNRNIHAVVVGYDHHINAFKIYMASIAVSKGARFLATNGDTKYDVKGRAMPDTGAMLSAVEASTGKRAEIVGKPSRIPFDLICEDHGVKDRSKVLMVGDTVETDINGAAAAGIDGCFVGKRKDGINAKYVVPSISFLSDSANFKLASQ